MSLSEQERQQLAEKLASMKYKQARKEIRRLDPDADLKIWRNSVGHNEWHTMYELPNLNSRVILVEQEHREDKGDRDQVDYIYVEARVEEYPVR